MIRRPPRSTRVRSSAASDVYKRQGASCRRRSGRCSWRPYQSADDAMRVPIWGGRRVDLGVPRRLERAREKQCVRKERKEVRWPKKVPGAPIPDEFRIWNSAHISPRCRSRRITNPENPRVDYIPVLSDCACCTRTGVRRRSSERTRVPRSRASQSWSRKHPSWRS